MSEQENMEEDYFNFCNTCLCPGACQKILWCRSFLDKMPVPEFTPLEVQRIIAKRQYLQDSGSSLLNDFKHLERQLTEGAKPRFNINESVTCSGFVHPGVVQRVFRLHDDSFSYNILFPISHNVNVSVSLDEMLLNSLD